MQAYARDVSIRDELLSPFREKLKSLQTSDLASKTKVGKGNSDLRGGSTTGKELDSSPVADKSKSVNSIAPQSKEEHTSQYDKKIRLTSLPKFSADNLEDGSTFDRWHGRLTAIRIS